MAKDDLKKLRSKDATERKTAIRGVAKSLDRTALHQLAVMSGDDPDPEIRKLAQQAGVYIRQKVGDIESDQPVEEKSSKSKRVVVEDVNAQKAQQLMTYASYQSENGDKVKAMKALVKAATLDPNLLDDSFYISLSESLTNLEGKEAIKALKDEARIEQTVKKEVLIKQDKETKAHQDEISSTTGRDVLFDIGLLMMISVVASVVLLFLTSYQASQYKTNFEANRKILETAFSEQGTPRIRWTDGSVGDNLAFDLLPQNVSLVYETPFQPAPAPEPAKTEIMKPTEFFEKTTLPYWSELGIVRILGRGIGLGVLVLLASLSLIGTVHLFALTFFGGEGRMAHTAHRLLSLFMGRTILFAIIGFVGIIIYFSSGGDTTLGTIFLAIFGIFAFFTFFIGASTIKKSYRFGIFSAFIVMLLGLVVALTVGGLGGFLLTTIV